MTDRTIYLLMGAAAIFSAALMWLPHRVADIGLTVFFVALGCFWLWQAWEARRS
jgi:predicted membrane channel-forming protein YqfA (hemolysin III family)